MLLPCNAEFSDGFVGDNIAAAARIDDKTADAVFDCTSGTKNIGS